MRQETRDILRALKRFEQTPESRGLDLRLSLSEMVITRLKANGWTQRELARRTGMKESFISRVVNSNANCTFDTAGALLFALGVEPKIIETQDIRPVVLTLHPADTGEATTIQRDITNGEETTCYRRSTDQNVSIQVRGSEAAYEVKQTVAT